MSAVAAFLAWLEGSPLATTVRGSLFLTASLSAVHLIGVTLIGGGAFFSGLRLCGALFADRPLADIVRPAGRTILLGLSISIATGILQFAPRAPTAAGSRYFQLKMLMLVGAVVCQVALYRRAVRAATPTDVGGAWTRLIGVVASALWIGVVAAGSAFILLE